MSKVTPTQRTLKEMRERGYLCEVVEKRIPFKPITKDLFGFIDILCVKAGEIVGVQATSRSNIASRVKKIAEHENVGKVRDAGIRILVMGWGKMANGRWEFREVDCS